MVNAVSPYIGWCIYDQPLHPHGEGVVTFPRQVAMVEVGRLAADGGSESQWPSAAGRVTSSNGT